MPFGRSHTCQLFLTPKTSLPEHAGTRRGAALRTAVILLLIGAVCCLVAVAQTAHYSGHQSVLPHYPSTFDNLTVAVDGSGNVYLSDCSTEIYKETPSGGSYIESTVPTNGLAVACWPEMEAVTVTTPPCEPFGV